MPLDAFPVHRSAANARSRDGFSLIEVVVVILILGVIAASAAPRLFNTSIDARSTSTRQSVSVLRSAVRLYKARTGEFPPTTTSDAFVTALQPYLNGPFPAPTTPTHRNANVLFIANDGTLSGGNSSDCADEPGWVFSPDTGRLTVNSSGIESHW